MQELFAEKRVVFVDDDPAVGKAVKLTLQSYIDNVECFSDPHICLAAIENSGCDLLITDVNMPGMNGLELLTKVKIQWPRLAVLVISAYADIPLAVHAVKCGAIDFIEKPFDEATLMRAVQQGLQSSALTADESNRLSDAERQVLRLVAEGKANKEIAHVLGRSVRTIENHRHRIMRKLQVGSSAELVKIAIAMGLTSVDISDSD